MLVVLFLTLAVIVIYLIYCLKTGIPESLSSTYYKISKPRAFQLTMFIVGLGLLCVWVSFSEEFTQFLAFLSCAGVLFVGAAPSFKQELEGRIHYSSAIICCVCAVLWQIIEGLWDVTLWFAWMGLMLSLTDRNKWCFWLELSVIGSVYFNLLRLMI